VIEPLLPAGAAARSGEPSSLTIVTVDDAVPSVPLTAPLRVTVNVSLDSFVLSP
jgi:hypothetical protein